MFAFCPLGRSFTRVCWTYGSDQAFVSMKKAPTEKVRAIRLAANAATPTTNTFEPRRSNGVMFAVGIAMKESSSGAWPAVKTNASSTPVSARSEEHTSELQSLMRNSYAVFCLKKKTQNKQTT